MGHEQLHLGCTEDLRFTLLLISIFFNSLTHIVTTEKSEIVFYYCTLGVGVKLVLNSKYDAPV